MYIYIGDAQTIRTIRSLFRRGGCENACIVLGMCILYIRVCVYDVVYECIIFSFIVRGNAWRLA